MGDGRRGRARHRPHAASPRRSAALPLIAGPRPCPSLRPASCRRPQEEDPEKYTAHFAEYLKAGLESDDLEDMYTKVPLQYHRHRTAGAVLLGQTAPPRAVPACLACLAHAGPLPARLGPLPCCFATHPPRPPALCVCACVLCAQVHEAIRADPAPQLKARSKPAESKRWKEVKLTYEQRKDKLKAKLSELMAGEDDE